MRSAIFTLLLIPALGLAQTVNDGISYQYLDVRYVISRLDAPGGQADGNGGQIGGAMLVRRHVHLFGSLDNVDYDGLDSPARNKSFGIGTQFDVADDVSVYGRLGYTIARVDLGQGTVKDDGALVSAGVRYMPFDGWEVRGAVQYSDLNDAFDTTAYSLGTDLYLTNAVALGFDWRHSSGTDAGLLGIRIYFGRNPVPGGPLP